MASRSLTQKLRSTVAVCAATSLATTAIIVIAPGSAMAVPVCDTTAPALGSQVTCDVAGSETITVPAGAQTATIEVAGGGGGWPWNGNTKGGNGALVTGTLDVSAVTAVAIRVAAAGEDATSGVKSGSGGDWSGITLNGRDIVIAGGGGGAGVYGTDGADAGQTPDGFGSSASATGWAGVLANGGTGGAGTTAGTGGTCIVEMGPSACTSFDEGMAGSDGQAYAGAGGVAGGGKSTDAGSSTSGGGAGWGGGGGGAKVRSAGSAGGGSGGTLVDATSVSNPVISSGGGLGGGSWNSWVTFPGWVSITFDNPTDPVVSAVAPPTGPIGGGTEITITGSGFTVSSSVTVGGAACAPVTFVSKNELKCLTAPHAEASTDVVVTNAGLHGSKPNGFSYTGPGGAQQCPITAVKPRPARAKLPVGKRVVLVGKFTTVPQCALDVRAAGTAARGDIPPFVRVKVKKNGHVVAFASSRNAIARVRAVATPAAAPYNEQSSTWQRSWRS